MLQYQFPSVTVLLLQRRSGWCEFPQSLSLAFPRVKVLEIRDAFKTFYNIALMVSSFPELETLTLDFVSYQEEGEDPCSLNLPPKLKTLNLQGNVGDVVRVLEWFDSAQPTPTLSTVRILSLTERHMGQLSGFLSKLRNSLQKLDLTFDFNGGSYFLPFPIRCKDNNFSGSLRIGDGGEAFTHLLTDAHTALQSLSLQAHSPEFYQHHLLTYLQNTQITELTILAHQSSLERSPVAWLSVDKLIVDCLAKYPRPNFILHARIQRISQIDIDQLARSTFPQCVELGIVNRVCESQRLRLTGKSARGPVSSYSTDYCWK
jgi:hypothetical protein